VRNPGLIYARISGYGQTGPNAPKAGFASVCEAYGGFRYVNGFPGEAPVRPNLSIGDTLAGIHAALGVLLAYIDAPALADVRRRLRAPAQDLLCACCDISDAADCARLIAVAEEGLGGPIDVFVAHAGRPFGGPLAQADPANDAVSLATAARPAAPPVGGAAPRGIKSPQ
jgi:hypothetical protein